MWRMTKKRMFRRRLEGSDFNLFMSIFDNSQEAANALKLLEKLVQEGQAGDALCKPNSDPMPSLERIRTKAGPSLCRRFPASSVPSVLNRTRKARVRLAELIKE